ncbi:MAG: hypothetical protein AB8B64_16505 [Granulosicoccus sp.]
MMNKSLKVGIFTIPLTLAGHALAATDGGLVTNGAASTGSSDVSIVKQVSVQITNVDDLDLGTHAQLSADVVATDDVCIFASDTTYFVTVSSVNGDFQLVGTDPANTMDYDVRWGATQLSYNTQIGTAQVGDPSDATCGGTENASYSVTVAQADFNAASYDTYTDTIIVSIIPE